MRERRLYVDTPLQTGTEVVIPKTTAQHINQVLRLKRNEEIVLFNGEGGEYLATLINVKRDYVNAFVEQYLNVNRESRLDIRMALGISRGERMDFAIQKSVELGVRELYPVKTDRSVIKLEGDRLEKRQRHWQSIANNACEQSGRNTLVKVNQVQTLEHWLRSSLAGLRITLSPLGNKMLGELSPNDTVISLLVGPEGGLSENEIQLSNKWAFESIRLGERIMRTETAGVAAIAAMQTLWGDFSNY